MINSHNKVIDKPQVLSIINKYTNIEINIQHLYYYQRAFAKDCFIEEEYNNKSIPEMFEKSNQTLEIVGDSVIGTVVVEYLEERFPREREGFINLLKVHIVKNEGLPNFSKALNFQKYLLISKETEKTIGRDDFKNLADCFEAFVGALFLDYKYSKNPGEAYYICRIFIISLIENLIDFSELIVKKDNFKTLLQEYVHTKKWMAPSYSDIKVEKNDLGFLFTRGIYVEKSLLSDYDITYFIKKFKDYKVIEGSKILIGIGKSYNKKISDQLCAKSCLEYFKPIILDELDLEIIQ